MAQTPTQRGPDARIREVNYTDGNVIQIRSAFRIATQIEFAPGEVIKFVAMGDTVSWEVAPADNSLFVKPRERAGATNVIRWEEHTSELQSLMRISYAVFCVKK